MALNEEKLLTEYYRKGKYYWGYKRKQNLKVLILGQMGGGQNQVDDQYTVLYSNLQPHFYV